MVSEKTSSNQEQPMRIILPELYSKITAKLGEDHNIHQYDIQARVRDTTSGYDVIIYFGDSFAHKESQNFAYEALENMNQDVTEFIEKIGESCKEVMIADYFKMMRPK